MAITITLPYEQNGTATSARSRDCTNTTFYVLVADTAKTGMPVTVSRVGVQVEKQTAMMNTTAPFEITPGMATTAPYAVTPVNIMTTGTDDRYFHVCKLTPYAYLNADLNPTYGTPINYQLLVDIT